MCGVAGNSSIGGGSPKLFWPKSLLKYYDDKDALIRNIKSATVTHAQCQVCGTALADEDRSYSVHVQPAPSPTNPSETVLHLQRASNHARCAFPEMIELPPGREPISLDDENIWRTGMCEVDGRTLPMILVQPSTRISRKLGPDLQNEYIGALIAAGCSILGQGDLPSADAPIGTAFLSDSDELEIAIGSVSVLTEGLINEGSETSFWLYRVRALRRILVLTGHDIILPLRGEVDIDAAKGAGNLACGWVDVTCSAIVAIEGII